MYNHDSGKSEKPGGGKHRNVWTGDTLDFKPASGGQHADTQSGDSLNLKPGMGYTKYPHGFESKPIPKNQQ